MSERPKAKEVARTATIKIELPPGMGTMEFIGILINSLDPEKHGPIIDSLNKVIVTDIGYK